MGVPALQHGWRNVSSTTFSLPPLQQLWEKFRPGVPLPKELGANRDYNIDCIPKFMMANGKLVSRLTP